VPKHRLFFLLLLLLPLAGSRPLSRHDFHTSVTQMQYNATGKTFEISVRLFTDDLEAALSRQSGQKIKLGGKDSHDALVEQYIRKHLAFTSPRKQLKPYQYVGKEPEAEATWVYLELPYNEPISGSLIRQDVLLDLFDDQVNLVNVSYQSERKTYLFKKNQTVHEISW